MRALLVATALVAIARTATAQCTDVHYRWTVKTADSLASVTPTRTSITAMLNSWTLPIFTGQDTFQCAPRDGHELKSYSLLGWVRRVKTSQDDGDWHIELTSRSDSPVDSCIVVEIPPAGLNANYGQARTDLKSLVTWNSLGDVIPPVHLRFVGAAFFDGEHRGADRSRTDTRHGRCNSSAHALWELHPVFWVKTP